MNIIKRINLYIEIGKSRQALSDIHKSLMLGFKKDKDFGTKKTDEAIVEQTEIHLKKIIENRKLLGLSSYNDQLIFDDFCRMKEE